MGEPGNATKTLRLVPGRECGACTSCCKDLTVVSPELKKPAGILCVHCIEEKGCGIYQARPPVCRDWFCGWWQMPNLDDSWRPDRSGILITAASDHIPPGYPAEGLTLELTGSLERLTWPPFLELVRALIKNNIPAFLSVRGAPGYTSGNIFLNDKLGEAVAADKREKIIQILFAAADVCANLPKKKVEFDD